MLFFLAIGILSSCSGIPESATDATETPQTESSTVMKV